MGTSVLSWVFKRISARCGAAMGIAACAIVTFGFAPTALADISPSHAHEGVASCGGSACHGRQVASPPDIRHDEIKTWQETNGAAGAHSRAWRVLTEPRAQAIAARLGLGPAQDAPACLGCHADRRGPHDPQSLFQLSDGVGCEAF